jgi:MFS family permease
MTVSAAAQPAPDRQTGVSAVLWSSCVATLAIGVNGTAIMAALPTMRADLALGAADVQWAVNAYLVVSAACIVLGGEAADRFTSQQLRTLRPRAGGTPRFRSITRAPRTQTDRQ